MKGTTHLAPGSSTGATRRRTVTGQQRPLTIPTSTANRGVYTVTVSLVDEDSDPNHAAVTTHVVNVLVDQRISALGVRM